MEGDGGKRKSFFSVSIVDHKTSRTGQAAHIVLPSELSWPTLDTYVRKVLTPFLLRKRALPPERTAGEGTTDFDLLPDEAFVFPVSKGTSQKMIENARQTQKLIQGILQEEGFDGNIKSFTCHALRHLYAVRCASSSDPWVHANSAFLMNHTTNVAKKSYNHDLPMMVAKLHSKVGLGFSSLQPGEVLQAPEVEVSSGDDTGPETGPNTGPGTSPLGNKEATRAARGRKGFFNVEEKEEIKRLALLGSITSKTSASDLVSLAVAEAGFRSLWERVMLAKNNKKGLARDTVVYAARPHFK